MSDSHDNLTAIEDAVKFFNSENVDLVIHAGDLISPFTAQKFKRLKMPFEAIFGNNDGERNGLKIAFSDLCVLEDFKDLNIRGRKIAVIHGTQSKIVDSLVYCGEYDVVVRGHTHQIDVSKDLRSGKTMVINPGEVCGYLSGKKTLVLLDPEDMSYELIEL
ncbi:metallophosphoesterase [Methanobacterium alcaliphilum]|nr:metallophosphoesterase [Methanobacterium alcaliphilum]